MPACGYPRGIALGKNATTHTTDPLFLRRRHSSRPIPSLSKFSLFFPPFSAFRRLFCIAVLLACARVAPAGQGGGASELAEAKRSLLNFFGPLGGEEKRQALAVCAARSVRENLGGVICSAAGKEETNGVFSIGVFFLFCRGSICGLCVAFCSRHADTAVALFLGRLPDLPCPAVPRATFLRRRVWTSLSFRLSSGAAAWREAVALSRRRVLQ